MIWLAIAMHTLAFLVLMAEVLIPSFGLLTAVAVALFGYSWYLVVTELGRAYTWIFGAVDLVLLPFAVKYAFTMMRRSPVTNREVLSRGSGLKPGHQPGADLVGRVGVVETQLHPTGKVLVDDQLVEATCETGILERGTRVRIEDIVGPKVLVEALPESEPARAPPETDANKAGQTLRTNAPTQSTQSEKEN